MIQVLGVKQVILARIKAPGDIETRRRQPHVIELGKSFEASGGIPIQNIVVSDKGVLVCGGDRFAAMLNIGIQRADAVIVKGEPEDLKRLTLIENVRRRHGGARHDQEVAELLRVEHPTPAESFPDIADASNDSEPSDSPSASSAENHSTHDAQLPNNLLIKSSVKRGRPKSEKTKAAEKVAAKLGTTSAAVTQAAYRTTKATEPPSEQPPAIDTWGLEVPKTIIDRTNLEHAALSAICKTLVQAQVQLTRAEKELGTGYETLRIAIHDAAASCKRRLPACVCLWCKLTKEQAKCVACHARGYLSAGELEVVTDRKLLERGKDAGIYVGGRFVLLKDVRCS